VPSTSTSSFVGREAESSTEAGRCGCRP
jgi:hypothetical protein